MEDSFNQNSTLHIICPAQRRAEPIVFSGLGLLILLVGVLRHWQETDFITGLGMSLMFLVLASIMYRNLLFRDELFITRDEAVPINGRHSVSADDIVSVRLRPPLDLYHARMERMGLATGPIEIVTKAGMFRFGAGLSEFSIDATIDRIVAFCEHGKSAPPPA